MQNKIKYANVEYVESGTYCGGEEEAWDLGIRSGDGCVVMKEAEFQKIELVFRLIKNDDSGDFEFVRHQIGKVLKGENP